MSCGSVCRNSTLDSLLSTGSVGAPAEEFLTRSGEAVWESRALTWAVSCRITACSGGLSNCWAYFSTKDHGGTQNSFICLLLQMNVPTSFRSAPRLDLDFFFPQLFALDCVYGKLWIFCFNCEFKHIIQPLKFSFVFNTRKVLN